MSVQNFLLRLNLPSGTRTKNLYKDMIFSFLGRGGSIAATLVMVPLTIDYVNPTRYGIWITLSTIISWFTFFDMGFGNGLKNKLAEALARKDFTVARKYVSTTYVFLACVAFLLLCVLLSANLLVDWARIFKSPQEYSGELRLVTMFMFAVFCVQFVFQIINEICLASQNTRIYSLMSFVSNFFALAVIFLLTRFTEGSLLSLCLSLGIAPLLTQVAFSLYLFRTKFRKFSPSIRSADRKLVSGIFNLGIQFFLIQIGVMFFYNSNNFIINHLYGPEAVTEYNIAFKYFNVITLISAVVMAPVWPAFTEAHVKNDNAWIGQTVSQLQRICLAVAFLSLMMLLLSPMAYRFWIGARVTVPFYLSAVLSFYTVLNMFRTIYCYYANGVGKLRIQLLLVLGAGLCNIPLGLFLGKILGPTGVILSTTILCCFCGVIELIQYHKLISNNAYGIWAK